ncbi:hypothetical protein Zmor_020224 [Zophobas morio]|uniref:Uncharacterized protein n=1 Tax=Zophobas morio TaxID=2755281 RepID=A0AA38I7E9_9CUCU|nr:hypothetical protein Zmor_020224 [Zophobas morio]
MAMCSFFPYLFNQKCIGMRLTYQVLPQGARSSECGPAPGVLTRPSGLAGSTPYPLQSCYHCSRGERPDISRRGFSGLEGHCSDFYGFTFVALTLTRCR